jgi:hypothetical protein
VGDEDPVFLLRPWPPVEPKLLAAGRPPHC